MLKVRAIADEYSRDATLHCMVLLKQCIFTIHANESDVLKRVFLSNEVVSLVLNTGRMF